MFVDLKFQIFAIKDISYWSGNLSLQMFVDLKSQIYGGKHFYKLIHLILAMMLLSHPLALSGLPGVAFLSFWTSKGQTSLQLL